MSFKKCNYEKDGCRGCDAPSENAFHALCECPRIRTVWDTGQVRLPVGWDHCASFADLFSMVSKSLSGQKMSLFAYQCWMCWNARNARVFEKDAITAADIIRDSPFMEMEYRVAQELSVPKEGPRVRPGPARWKAPAANSVKVNTDAATFSESRSIGLGACLRDCNGKMLWALSSQLPGLKAPVVAEALAVREAIKAVSRMRFENVVVESDNQEVVNALAGKGVQWRSELQGIIFDCLEYGKSMGCWSVQHVRRDGNKVAHGLAKLSSSFNEEMIWYHDFPSSIVNIARCDLARV